MTFSDDARTLLPDLIALRRALHADPEVGLRLPRTQKRVLEALEGLGLETAVGSATTSVIAILRGSRPGPVVLLRGDMDALPVAEETGLDFASSNGLMHACGHDLHTAGLVGAARLLAARRHELPGTVIFMFQPGEEGFDGAQVMIDEGVLDAAGERPVAAYGIHVAPGPFGVFGTRVGAVLAGANTLHITVNGAGGHASQPHSAVDPVPALAAIVTALQTMVTRRFSVQDPVVLSVTQLAAGEAIGVIPPSATLGATVRTLSDTSVDRLIAETRLVAEGVAAAHGCTADVDFDVTYPVTMNDEAETIAAIATVRSALGDDNVAIMAHPLMGSEDFSRVLAEVPGTFFMLGATPPGVEATAWNHSRAVLFDDAVLAGQAAALAELALARLQRD